MTITPITSEDQWHGLRRKHIGASEAGVLFGDHPYETLASLYFEKTGIYSGELHSALADFGRDMEPIIAKWAAEQNGWDVLKSNEYHEHPDHPYLGCTLDYYILTAEDGPGLMQIKNVQNFAPGWTQTRAPDHVEFQVQQELLVCNAAREAAGQTPFAYNAIVSLHAGNPEDIRVMLRQPNEKVHKAIIERGGKFWEMVESRSEPEVTGSQDFETIKGLFMEAEEPDEEDEVLDMRGQPQIDDLCAELEKARALRLSYDKEEKAIKTRLMRYAMEIDNDEVIGYPVVRTDNYVINLNKSITRYKAQEAREIETLRFNVKPIKC